MQFVCAAAEAKELTTRVKQFTRRERQEEEQRQRRLVPTEAVSTIRWEQDSDKGRHLNPRTQVLLLEDVNCRESPV